MLIAAALLLAIHAAPSERPASTSTTYRTCRAAAESMADHRACLAAEVEWGRRAVDAAVAGTGIDAESQAMWRRLVEHDCQGEYEIATGGNSAGMRRDACLIEMQAERVSYLLRRGNF